MPAMSFNANINMISSISGDKIVARSMKSPAAPTAFFIRLDEARISPIPSLRYEPRSGT